MNYNYYIAKRLKLSGDNNKSSLILDIAKYGIAIAIIVMILAVSVLFGFRNEITDKIYSLDSHIKISLTPDYNDHSTRPIDYVSDSTTLSSIDLISRQYKVVEKNGVIKTDNNYKGINIKGYDSNFDYSDLVKYIIKGDISKCNNTKTNNIAISYAISNELGLDIGDDILIYFIDGKVKIRKFYICAIYKTDFNDFDNVTAISNIRTLQKVNNWNDNECSYIGLKLKDTGNVRTDSYTVFDILLKNSLTSRRNITYDITNLYDEYLSYFAWLDLLNTNMIIIIILMSFVSGFTLIAGLLIIILDRIKTIGILKSMGITNTSIRAIFIMLTYKLIIKSVIISNIIGVAICILQHYTNIIKLDPESYYMSFVPVDINVLNIVIIDLFVTLFSAVTLIIPSLIISKILPGTTLRYE